MIAARSEFRRGWRVLLGAGLGVATGVSSLYFYSLGLFLKPLAVEFGWTRGQASLGPLVGTACAAVMCVPIGRLVDRIGAVRVAVGSLALLAASFVALAVLARGLFSFLVLTAGLSVLTAGSSPLPFTRLVISSFREHRGLALGLVLSATGAGAIAVPALLPGLIADYGWRSAYLALAGLIVATLPVTVWLLRDLREAEPPRRPAGAFRAIMRQPAFALLGGAFFCASVAVFGTLVHFVPMLTDAAVTPERAGRIAAFIGSAAIVGRVVVGFMLDRLPSQHVAVGLFGSVSLGLVVLGWGGPAMAVPGALVIGLAIGVEADLMAFFVARQFVEDDYGRAYGGLYTVFLVGGALGPALAGLAFDLAGNYRAWLLAGAALLTLAAGLMTRLGHKTGQT